MSDQSLSSSTDLDVDSQVASWFALVDAGKGDVSWSSAGALFRGALDPALWATYHSVYDRNRAVVETLTMQRETDGVWRVVGYFIR